MKDWIKENGVAVAVATGIVLIVRDVGSKIAESLGKKKDEK